MKIAITGLSNSGKTTVFNALTGLGIETTVYPTTGGDPHTAVVKVPDERIDKLSSIFKPKKTTYSTVQYIDYLGLTKGDLKQNKSVFELVKDVDAVVQVARAFEDDSVVHPLGDINPLRDVETIEMEMIFGDLDLVERRLESMEAGTKRGKKPDEAEKKVLLKCKEALEGGTPLRNLEFSEDEQKAFRHLQFMSVKPATVVINISENDLAKEKSESIRKPVQDYFGADSRVTVITLSGKVEMDIAGMPEDEAGAFLEDLGIKEPAKNMLIRVSYENVGLISFFTVGEDEVRAWAITKGTDALKAAGKIHTDIQRGFIRAEVVSYEEFMKAGSLPAARDKGILRLEGKTYEVRDGDIINFRFNV